MRRVLALVAIFVLVVLVATVVESDSVRAPSGVLSNPAPIEVTSTSTPAATPAPAEKPAEKPAASKGTMVGRVTLSPVCPVERTPPDPGCAPKPYRTTIRITSETGVKTSVPTDASGSFVIRLLPGTYSVMPDGGAVLPRCAETSARVVADSTVTLELSCDTGIR